MKVLKAKITQCINIYKEGFRGYEEVVLELDEKSKNEIKFTCNWLNIEDVTVISGSTNDINYMMEKTDSRFPGRPNILKVEFPMRSRKTEVFVLRILYSACKDSPGLVYYHPVTEEDKHRELIVYNSSYAFPRLEGSILEVDFVYILPNARDVQISSAGTFISMEEKHKSIIYQYKKNNCDMRNFLLAIGTYKLTQLAETIGIYAPAKMEIDLSEFIFDLKSSIQFLHTFTDTSMPSIVFTLNDIDVCDAPSLIVFPLFMLGSPLDIEANFALKQRLCYLVAKQVLMFQRFSMVDSWIFEGLTGYIGDHLYRHLVGHNEFIYHYITDRNFVVSNDITEPPLYHSRSTRTFFDSEFFRKKSKLVFHTLDSRLSTTFMKKIIDSLIKLPQKHKEVSVTPYFIKIVSDLSGSNFRPFFNYYVFKPGLLEITLYVSVDTKKNITSISCKTVPTSILSQANRTFFSPIQITSVETEGRFNHKISLDGINEYSIHKKGDEGDLLFIRADFKRASSMNKISVIQHDFMNIEQLLENEAFGQFEAIDALKDCISENVLSVFDQVLDELQTFHRIKQKIFEIIKDIRIPNVSDQENMNFSFNGLMRLIQMFIKLRCLPNSTILKSTSAGIANFLIQKALVKSIAEINVEFFVQDTEEWWSSKALFVSSDRLSRLGLCNDLRVAISFLHNIINYNDSTCEFFDDPFYLFCVLNKYVSLNVILAKFTGEENSKQQIKACIIEIERFRLIDMAFPSFNNLISKVCLLSLIRLAYHGYATLSSEFLFQILKYPNFIKLRMLALEGILLLFSDSSVFVYVVASTSYFLIIHFLSTLVTMIEFGFKNILKLIRLHKSLIMSLHEKYPEDFMIVSLLGLIDEAMAGHIINQKDFHNFRMRIMNLDIDVESVFSIDGEKCLGLKRLTVTDLLLLRQEVLKKTFRIRMKVPLISQVPAKKNVASRIIRMKVSKPFVRQAGIGTILRFIYNPLRTVHTQLSISALIINTIKNSKHFILIDKLLNSQLARAEDEGYSFEEIQEIFIRKNKPIKVSDDSQLVHKELICLCGFISVLFRAFRTVMVSVEPFSKPYNACKNYMSTCEKLVYNNLPIVGKVTLMDSDMLEKIEKFLQDEIFSSTHFDISNEFTSPETHRTYADLVRFPISLDTVKSKIKGTFTVAGSKVQPVPKQCFYKTFEAFFCDIERIGLNACAFYPRHSDAFVRGTELLKKLKTFTENLDLSKHVDSKSIIAEIIQKNNHSNIHFNFIKEEIATWNDFEEFLNTIKKKHSRHTNNGKALIDSISSIYLLIYQYFSVWKGKIFRITD